MARVAIAALTALIVATPAHAQWFYLIGVEKVEQQAQFCDNEQDTRDLADLFRRKGGRASYFAMEQIYECNTQIATFTPLEVIERVLVKTKLGDYDMNFVRVRMRDGATRYLVTARDVKDST